MRDFSEDQVFTVFGGSYVSEHHGNQFLTEPRYASSTKVIVLLGALMVGFSSAATAMTTRQAENAVPLGAPLQNIPGIVTLARAIY